MRLTILLLLLSLSSFVEAQVSRIFNSSVKIPNTNLGFSYLVGNAKTGWVFTGISGAEEDAITSVASVAGTSNALTNNAGGLTPRLGFTQIETSIYSGLNANTESGTSPKEAMISINQPDIYFQSDFEVLITFRLEDGQSSSQYLMGVANGGTQRFDIAVNPSGDIVFRIGAGAAISTFTATGNALSNNYTGVVYLRSRFDFTNDEMSVFLNGVPLTVSLTSGSAFSTINPANFNFNIIKLGVGGSWDGAFAADANHKFIHKLFITPLMSSSNALYVANYMIQL